MRNFYLGAKFGQKNPCIWIPELPTWRGGVVAVAGGGVGGWAERVEPLVTRLRKKEKPPLLARLRFRGDRVC